MDQTIRTMPIKPISIVRNKQKTTSVNTSMDLTNNNERFKGNKILIDDSHLKNIEMPKSSVRTSNADHLNYQSTYDINTP